MGSITTEQHIVYYNTCMFCHSGLWQKQLHRFILWFDFFYFILLFIFMEIFASNFCLIIFCPSQEVFFPCWHHPWLCSISAIWKVIQHGDLLKEKIKVTALLRNSRKVYIHWKIKRKMSNKMNLVLNMQIIS